ncbi:hypothetical protein [Tautonia plasticadhaerens]|uniref:SMI1/KNR4 family protein n=1 Tax=Tautonia plasticadhaerens TaxID=2527974 RepID=A0A518H2J1_9BACT|nr:hypothetical protein [Tautonia plasticadhaerens]QDV35027.1 hypothetical protein ElP_29250 [Tautonia plasticadhaerens]
MTEAEWESCTIPMRMLEFLGEGASDRKLRLFACACCRRFLDLLPDDDVRSALDTAERFADGMASLAELQEARRVAYGAYVEFSDTDASGQFRGWESASLAVAGACWTEAEGRDAGLLDVVDNTFGLARSERCRSFTNPRIERRRQCRDLRDLFGNPFRPITFEPNWITSEAAGLALAIDRDRAFDRMPILGDALEAAGCDLDPVLSHCRSRHNHIRGCWVVDSILGRS